MPCACARDERLLLRGKRKQATSGLWGPGRIRGLITNSTYKGSHEYGKRTQSKRPPVIRTVPAIVTADVWAKAQENLQANFLFGARGAKNKYVLISETRIYRVWDIAWERSPDTASCLSGDHCRIARHIQVLRKVWLECFAITELVAGTSGSSHGFSGEGIGRTRLTRPTRTERAREVVYVVSLGTTPGSKPWASENCKDSSPRLAISSSPWISRARRGIPPRIIRSPHTPGRISTETVAPLCTGRRRPRSGSPQVQDSVSPDCYSFGSRRPRKSYLVNSMGSCGRSACPRSTHRSGCPAL